MLLVAAMLISQQLVAQFAVSQFITTASVPLKPTTLTTSNHLFGTLEWTNADVLNSDQKDFSPVFFENGIVFPSTRKAAHKKQQSQLKDKYYFARINSQGHIRAVRSFDTAIKSFDIQGPICFSPTGQTLFFAQPAGKNINGQTIYHLQFIQKTKKSWGKQKQLPLNVNGYTSQHPYLSKDATRLYFSSNQPGGYGGMDIYVAYYDNGIWSEPINLGPEVNSAADEMYPTLGEDQQLYFASSKEGGQGGLDVYTASQVKNSEVKLFGKVENLGEPFNSKFDDFGFVMNQNLTGGFFTSNRPGGKGDFDIYNWDIKKRLIQPQIATVNPSTSSTSKEEKIISEDKEALSLSTEAFIDQITEKVSKEVSNNFTNTAEETANNAITQSKSNSKKHKYAIGQKITFSNVTNRSQLDDFGQSELRYLLNILRDHPDMVISMKKNETKNDLTFVKSYLTKNGIQSDRLTFSNNRNTKEDGEFSKKGTTIEILELENKAKHNSTALTKIEEPLASNKATPKLASYDRLMFEKMAMGKGTKLTKVHYGYNEYELEAEAIEELDRIADLMIQFPSMQLGVFGHTDSFGSNGYNLKLSQKRAAFVKAYLVSKGVNPSRLQTKAQGESNLIFNCQVSSSCTKDNQRINRRTELIILDVNQNEITDL